MDQAKRLSFSISPSNVVDVQDKVDEVAPPTSLTVYGNINLPEVVLFSEPEKDNSKLLIMSAELKLEFNSKNSCTELRVKLEDICLRLGEFNNQKLGIPFLNPCKARIEMKQLDPKCPAHYRAAIPKLYFSITPTIYEVVMGVINTLNRSGTEQKEKETEIKKLLEDSEPFVKRKIDKNKYILNGKSKPAIQEELDDVNLKENEPKKVETHASSNTTVKKLQKVVETLDLKIEDALVIFCEEVGLDLQPLLSLNFKLDGNVSNWTKNLHMKAKLTLEGSYYNDRLHNWEPLVENFLIKEDLYRPWMLNMWFAMENGGILQPPADQKSIETIEFPVKSLDYSTLDAKNNTNEPLNDNEEGPTDGEKSENFEFNKATYILINSNDILSINVTPSAYKVIVFF